MKRVRVRIPSPLPFGPVGKLDNPPRFERGDVQVRILPGSLYAGVTEIGKPSGFRNQSLWVQLPPPVLFARVAQSVDAAVSKTVS